MKKIFLSLIIAIFFMMNGISMRSACGSAFPGPENCTMSKNDTFHGLFHNNWNKTKKMESGSKCLCRELFIYNTIYESLNSTARTLQIKKPVRNLNKTTPKIYQMQLNLQNTPFSRGLLSYNYFKPHLKNALYLSTKRFRN